MRGLQSFRWPVKLAMLVIALLAVISIGSGWWLPWDPAAIDLQQRLSRAAKVDIDKRLHRYSLIAIAVRRRSARMLNEMEVIKIIRPGRAATHGWV